jgi:hypothetical protein
MTTERKNSGAERKGTFGLGMHRPGSNLTLAGVCPPMTQTGPEIFFLRPRTAEERKDSTKEEILSAYRHAMAVERVGSLTSSEVVTSSWFIVFYYLSVKIDHTAGQPAGDKRFANQIVRLIALHLSHAC